MKKFMAMALALTLAVSCTACGSVDDSSENSEAAIKAADTSTSSASESTTDTDNSSEAADSNESETDAEYPEYEIVTSDYYIGETDFQDYNGLAVNNVANAALEFCRAYVSDDTDKVNDMLGTYLTVSGGEISSDSSLELAVDLLVSTVKIDKNTSESKFDADIEKVEIFNYEETEADSFAIGALIYTDSDNASPILARGVTDLSDNSTGVCCIEVGKSAIERLVQYVEGVAEIDDYKEESKLKSANSYAREACNSAMIGIAELESENLTDEIKEVGGTYEISSLADSDNEILKQLYSTFSNLGYTDSYVYISLNDNTVDFIQWKESEDSAYIGQYPDPISSTDTVVTWGEKYEE